MSDRRRRALNSNSLTIVILYLVVLKEWLIPVPDQNGRFPILMNHTSDHLRFGKSPFNFQGDHIFQQFTGLNPR